MKYIAFIILAFVSLTASAQIRVPEPIRVSDTLANPGNQTIAGALKTTNLIVVNVPFRTGTQDTITAWDPITMQFYRIKVAGGGGGGSQTLDQTLALSGDQFTRKMDYLPPSSGQLLRIGVLDNQTYAYFPGPDGALFPSRSIIGQQLISSKQFLLANGNGGLAQIGVPSQYASFEQFLTPVRGGTFEIKEDVDTMRTRINTALAGKAPLNSSSASTINGKIAAGSNVVIAGTGTNADPYVVSASGSGGGAVQTLNDVLNTGNTATDKTLRLSYPGIGEEILNTQRASRATVIVGNSDLGAANTFINGDKLATGVLSLRSAIGADGDVLHAYPNGDLRDYYLPRVGDTLLGRTQLQAAKDTLRAEIAYVATADSLKQIVNRSGEFSGTIYKDVHTSPSEDIAIYAGGRTAFMGSDANGRSKIGIKWGSADRAYLDQNGLWGAQLTVRGPQGGIWNVNGNNGTGTYGVFFPSRGGTIALTDRVIDSAYRKPGVDSIFFTRSGSVIAIKDSVGAGGGGGAETDPTVPSNVKAITGADISNWNTAYGWGNHASAGYATTSDVSNASTADRNRANHTGTQDTSTISNLTAGLNRIRADINLKSPLNNPTFTGTVTAPALNTGSITLAGPGGSGSSFVDFFMRETASGNNRGWLHSYRESGNEYKMYYYSGSAFIDVMTLSTNGNAAFGGAVTGSNLNISNWNAAYGWGNHATAGYATTSDVSTASTADRARANHTGTQPASTISDFVATAAAAAPVQSVFGRSGAVTGTKTDVGLGNVDNTSDANKPVSTAQQSALNGKANTTHTHSATDITSGTLPAARISGTATDGYVPKLVGGVLTYQPDLTGGGGGATDTTGFNLATINRLRDTAAAIRAAIPSGGGGSSPWTLLTKSSDQTAAALVPVTDLTFPVVSGKTYQVRATLIYTGSGNGYISGSTVSSGPTTAFLILRTGATTVTTGATGSFPFASVANSGIGIVNLNYAFIATVSGTCDLSIGSGVSIKLGSYLEYMQF